MFSLLVFCFFIGSAISCTCIPPPSLADDFSRTSRIFIGRVITKAPQTSPYISIEFTVEVEIAFKGTTVGSNVRVSAWENGSMCGIGPVSVGQRWQMWLTESGMTSSCSRSTTNAYRDLEALLELSKS